MNTTPLFIRILSASLLLTAATSFAGDWGVGISGNNTQDVYQDHDDDISLNIFPEYRGERFNLDFESLSYRLMDDGKYNLEILAKHMNLGYVSGDSTHLTGMDDRDGSINLGLRASYTTDYGVLSLHAVTDVLGSHKGQEVSLQFGEPFYTTHWRGKRDLSLGLLGGVRWQSDDVIDYYYGIKTSDATASRAAFKGKSAITPFIGIEINAGLTEHISLEAAVRYDHLPDNITDSAIASNNGVQARLGLSYWF